MPSKRIPVFNSVDEVDNFFKKPEPTIPCEKCGKLFRAENEEMVWARRLPQYKNYCYDCYKDAINENPSEEQIREWAEDSIDRSQGEYDWLIPFDCSYKNFKDKVEPIIDEILKEREQKQKRDYRQKKIDEAQKLIDDAHLTCDENGDSYDYHGHPIMHDIIMINVIATLLEKIEELEEKASKRDIWNDRFTI